MKKLIPSVMWKSTLYASGYDTIRLQYHYWEFLKHVLSHKTSDKPNSMYKVSSQYSSEISRLWKRRED